MRKLNQAWFRYLIVREFGFEQLEDMSIILDVEKSSQEGLDTHAQPKVQHALCSVQ